MDREFLYELHCLTMREVIEATWDWEDGWQRSEFGRRIREYDTSIIEWGGRVVGGLMLESKPDSIYVHEIQVSPEFQRQGIGTAVIRQVVEQAARRGVAVTLSVVQANFRARELYERLGFEVESFEAPFFRMRHDCQRD